MLKACCQSRAESFFGFGISREKNNVDRVAEYRPRRTFTKNRMRTPWYADRSDIRNPWSFFVFLSFPLVTGIPGARHMALGRDVPRTGVGGRNTLFLPRRRRHYAPGHVKTHSGETVVNSAAYMHTRRATTILIIVPSWRAYYRTPHCV